MSNVLLVRHCDAVWSEDEMGALSAQGSRDAERLADVLAGAGVEAIYSSPFRRARETVEPLARRCGLAIQEVADLRERCLGAGPLVDVDAAVGATWGNFSFAHPGGESNVAAQRRIVAAFSRLVAAHPGGRILLSTHGNALALLLHHYDPSIGFYFWRALSRPDVYRMRLHASRAAAFNRVWNPDAGGRVTPVANLE